MSTRSMIGIRREGGRVEGVYCHWDGYPSYVGRILAESYTEPEKVEALLALGDISILGAQVAPPPGALHSYRDPADGVTVAYARDRGDDLERAQVYPDDRSFAQQDYNYIFEPGTKRWVVSTGSSYADLEETIKSEKDEDL